MTKPVVKKRVLISCIAVLIAMIIAIAVFILSVWAPLFGVMRECRGVFSGKILSEDENLGRFNFDNDDSVTGATEIKGFIFFTYACHNENEGVIYAYSRRSYYNSNGKLIYRGVLEPMKIEVEKAGGEWKVSYICYLAI